MLIIWRGWGILAILIPVACFLLVAGIFGIAGKGTALDNPAVGLVVAGVVSAVLVWWLGNKLNSAPGRELIDPKTQERIIIRKSHQLFWIPMQWWAIPIVLFACFALAGLFLAH